MASDRTPVDFARLAAALLERAEYFVSQWLPAGHREGHEWVEASTAKGGMGDSLKANLVTGRWSHFSAQEQGGDLVSLYAYLHNLNNGQAARELMRELGWVRPSAGEAVQTPARAAAGGDGRPDPPPEDGAAPARPGRKKGESKWRAVVPVPPHAPRPEFVFGYRDRSKPGEPWVELQATRTWEYRFEGALLGYVARFEREDSDGKLVKDTVARTWCEDTSDGRGTQRWHWKQWEAPRPLYVPATLLSGDLQLPVVVVEGEKCAEAGHQLLGHEFDFVSWPGGAKAWAKASWGWLMGRTVYLWPDCDAQHVALTRAEREQGLDPKAKPLLPAAKQPGMAAMVAIGSQLMADHGCTVLLCQIPAPGEVAEGWDIADAIAQGWTADQVRGFIRRALEFVPPDDTARAKAGRSTPTLAGAAPGEDAEGEGEPDRSWRRFLISSGTGAIKPVRENVVLALDGMDHAKLGRIEGLPEASALIAFNDFTNDVEKRRATPWGTAAGVWEEQDELEMGNWLAREHWLPSMPRGTLEEAVTMVAKRHRFHPVRERFEGLRGAWDREPRLHRWLRQCCLPEDEIDERLQAYLEKVGAWLLMAICARVMRPGCKFDYMVIFEGKQGLGKSTLASVLGLGYFADTGLVLGDKDSYQNIQGVLVYEWGELDAMSKSEVTKVKQFVSSQKDRFRASFDRRPKDYPRQVVFIGTTNEGRYLIDQTGNRRFWPVPVHRHVDIGWLQQHLEQLFAEALARLDAGERFYPTPAEQRELFDPQQGQRQVENAIEAAIRRYLYDESQHISANGVNGALVSEVTVSGVLSSIGISVDKQTAVIVRQASASLRQLGWTLHRSGKAERPWVYRRPPGAPAAHGASESSTGEPTQALATTGGDDDPPF
ncbi:MAG: hypothetical protein KF788_08755 [Piscinibacter sp.]|nr:hypothetical protein [Piscinibacter sp.]